MRIRIGCRGVLWLVGLSLWLAGSRALAQQGPPPAPGAPATSDDTTPLEVPSELVRIQPGGLTADSVGNRAAATSWNAKAAHENLRGAAARVDEAWAGYLPRLSGLAKYTRLSNFTPPAISLVPSSNAPSGGGMGMFGQNGPGLVLGSAPASGMLGSDPCTPPNKCFVAPAGGFAFPLVLDNWLLQATLTVPLSDYLLRIDQTYSAATHSQEAAQWDEIGARASSASNGKIAYYSWLRERAAVIVAIQALNEQKTHLRDARNQFAVGNASKADVLRTETAMASAELSLERAKNLADLSEKQVRVAVHAPDSEAFAPGEGLEGPLPPLQGSVHQLTAEALSARPEIKSADANAASARQQAAANKAGRYPALSAFADAIYANPNPRYFPQTNLWFPTWDVGAQLTWSPNDLLVANGSVADADSRVASIEANKNVVRDNIEVEVTQDWQAVREADFSIETSQREVASAEEAYRVARELFNNGRGTSTTLNDAETDLTRARYDLLNARAEARIARVRLEHALGRDAHATAP